jgi:hypothetical protein
MRHTLGYIESSQTEEDVGELLEGYASAVHKKKYLERVGCAVPKVTEQIQQKLSSYLRNKSVVGYGLRVSGEKEKLELAISSLGLILLFAQTHRKTLAPRHETAYSHPLLLCIGSCISTSPKNHGNSGLLSVQNMTTAKAVNQKRKGEEEKKDKETQRKNAVTAGCRKARKQSVIATAQTRA